MTQPACSAPNSSGSAKCSSRTKGPPPPPPPLEKAFAPPSPHFETYQGLVPSNCTMPHPEQQSCCEPTTCCTRTSPDVLIHQVFAWPRNHRLESIRVGLSGETGSKRSFQAQHRPLHRVFDLFVVSDDLKGHWELREWEFL